MKRKEDFSFYATVLFGLLVLVLWMTAELYVQDVEGRAQFVVLEEPTQPVFFIGMAASSEYSDEVYAFANDEIDTNARYRLRADVGTYGISGTSVTLLDYNGDGVDDVAIGGSQEVDDGLLVRIYSGKSDHRILLELNSDYTNDFLHASVFSVGDMNFDGIDDLAITNRDSGSFARPDEHDPGRYWVKVFSYRNGELYTLYSPDYGVYDSGFGYAVAGFDLDNDGINELAIGSPYEFLHSQQGSFGKGILRVYKLSRYFQPMPLWSAAGFDPGDQFGISLASIGDINGYGEDLLIGAPRYVDTSRTVSGKAYVYGLYRLPSTEALVFSQLREYTGSDIGDRFGKSISGVGDVTGDGVNDVLIGAPYHDSTPGANDNVGAVYVYSGSSVSQRVHFFEGRRAQDRYGISLAGVGDINQDNRPDYIVGAPFNAFSRGRVKLFSGRTGEVLADYYADPRGISQFFGQSLAGRWQQGFYDALHLF